MTLYTEPYFLIIFALYQRLSSEYKAKQGVLGLIGSSSASNSCMSYSFISSTILNYLSLSLVFNTHISLPPITS